jgi:alpha-D-xyloside xylohydrolase
MNPSCLPRLFTVILAISLCGSAFAVHSSNAADQSVQRTDDGITLTGTSGTLNVGVCSQSVIHVVFKPKADVEFPSIPVAIQPCTGAHFKISSDRAHVVVKTTALTVSIDRATDSVRFLSTGGSVVLAEQPNGRTIQPKTIEGASTLQVEQGFQLSPGEAIYGLGQRPDGSFNLRGTPIQLLQANTNIAIPFLLSTKGYGLLWNNASLTDFDPTTKSIDIDPKTGEGIFHTDADGEYGFLIQGNFRQKLQLTVCGQSVVDLNNMWVPRAAGGKIYLKANTTCQVHAETGGDTKVSVRYPSNTMAFQSQAGKSVNYYFFYGPQLDKVVAEYRRMTGTVPMLPRWAYGFWQCRERYSSQDQILQVAAKFRKDGIPVDAIVQDWQYWGKYGWNAMRFDEDHYPHPAQMLSSLHQSHFHFVISVWAKFGEQTGVYKQFKSHDFLLQDKAETAEPGEAQAQESWADLFNPGADKLFWQSMDKHLFKDGVDGWWLDASEPEGDPLRTSNTYLGPGAFVRNAYPLYEISAVYKGQTSTNPQKRVVILTRSAYAGQQRTGSISWSGDISANWLTLRRQIPEALSFSMSGFPYWTSDIGGFFRPENQYTSAAYHQLLIRWFEFGAFSPIFRVHGFHSRTEMWNYGPETEKILVGVDKLRYRLLPYIYSSAWEVTSQGRSIMRALPFVYPDQPALRNISDEYLFGDSLLINPVTRKNATDRSVTLPAGSEWIDFWTGEKHQGGQTIVAPAPLNHIPVFVKSGSIVPMGPVLQWASQPEEPLDIRIYPGHNASFQLYEDAGNGYGYQHRQYAIVPLHWNNHDHMLTIGRRKGSFPGMPRQCTIRIEVVRPGHGVGAELDPHPDRIVSYTGKVVSVSIR